MALNSSSRTQVSVMLAQLSFWSGGPSASAASRLWCSPLRWSPSPAVAARWSTTSAAAASWRWPMTKSARNLRHAVKV